jgi:hypothetical protein
MQEPCAGRGPRRSISRPTHGVTAAETRKPNEKMPEAGVPVPAEIVEYRRKQQGKRGAGIDPDRHCHEGNGNQP